MQCKCLFYASLSLMFPHSALRLPCLCVSALSCTLCLIDGNCVLTFHPSNISSIVIFSANINHFYIFKKALLKHFFEHKLENSVVSATNELTLTISRQTCAKRKKETAFKDK